jgi:hypothetical protein
MGPFEYLLMFASVILALALTDVAVSLNRLLGAADKVKWDWLAPLAALVAFLKIVNQWWVWFAGKAVATDMTYGMFLGILVSAILLFLMCAAALPDALDEPGDLDLRAYYGRVSRRYWLLFAGHWLTANGTSIWIQIVIEKARFAAVSPAYLILPIALALAFFRDRRLHGAGLIAFALLYLAFPFAHRLAG